jgi:hypothetical protein
MMNTRPHEIGETKAELVARLEVDRESDVGEGCEWEGKVGELGAPLEVRCSIDPPARTTWGFWD